MRRERYSYEAKVESGTVQGRIELGGTGRDMVSRVGQGRVG